GILVILVALQFLCRPGVDGHFHGPVGADRHFAFRDNLRRLLMAAPPPADGPLAAPFIPAGVPRVIRCEPPVTSAVEPIPGAARIPGAVVPTARDLVLDLGIRYRGAEVVLGLNGGDDRLAQAHGLLGRFDLHFKLGLLVLLNSKTAAAVIHDL